MQRDFLSPHMKIPTGITGLDRMLRGGLLPGRPYLVVGPPGSGKTTLSLEFLLRGVRDGEEVLYVTLEEPPNEIRADFRGLGPDLLRIWVFDAIPDVMRYEKAPFKDIAAVRSATQLGSYPESIRKTGEFTSVEVTFSALIQTLKMETVRRLYTRLVVDSLTALEFFCMKGFDEQQGAQAFLRFLSDLGITTLLTVETPLEDLPSAERLLARGELHLFQWDVEGKTVRALGVEKFRGSGHDVRLHPFRLSAHGLDVDISSSLARESRVMAPVPSSEREELPRPTDAELMVEARRAILALQEDVRGLLDLGLDVEPVRQLLTGAHRSLSDMRTQTAFEQILEARQMVNHLLLAHEVSREFSGKPFQPTLIAPRGLSAGASTVPSPGPEEAAEASSAVGPTPVAESSASALLPLLGRLVGVLEGSRGRVVSQNLSPALLQRAARAAGVPGLVPPGRPPEASASLRTGPSGAPRAPATGTTAPGLERVRLFPAPPSGGPGNRRPSAIRRLPDRPAEPGPHPSDASPPRILPATTPPDAARSGTDGPPTTSLRPAVQTPGPPREGPTTAAGPTSPGGPKADPRPVVERVQRARGASAGKEPEAEELPGGPLAEETEEGPTDPDPGTSEDGGQVGGPP